MTQLFESDAVQLTELVRSGDVSCREVIEAHLARVNAINQRLGAITVTLDESALRRANELDCVRERGPLHGVPVTVKENLDCMGSATTHGLPALRNALPHFDSPVVERLKAAGSIRTIAS